MKIKFLFPIALACFAVVCESRGTGAAAGAQAAPAPLPATAQTPQTTQTPQAAPAPGTQDIVTNNSGNNPNNPNMRGGINGRENRDVNGEGRGVYLNGTYYRNGTYGYNTNLGTGSGYANTNSFYWTTNPPEPRYNQGNTTQLPGNALPTPITLPSQSPGNSTPPPVNSVPPPVNSTPPADNSTPPPVNSTPPPVNSTPPQS
jgi:hypothetical protein